MATATQPHGIGQLQTEADLRRFIEQLLSEPRFIQRAALGLPVERMGTASVADGDTIAHGLRTAPRWANVTPTVPNRSVSVTRDADNLTISLTDDTGAAVAVAEDVMWRAIA